MKNQVVIVTGAASGIGLKIATSFAKNGVHTVLTDMNGDAVRETAAQLQQKGYSALGLGCDVTDEDQVVTIIQETVSRFGRVEVLVNNAGLQYVSNLEDFPTDMFERMIKVMLTAPFVCMKHVFPIMKQQKYGRIINMASINGLIGFAGKAAYNSAKHGVIGLTKVAALEGADQGITVNAICPGYVDTPLVRNQLEDLAKTRNVPLEKVLEEVIYPLVPQKRLLTTQEIADYVMFLASERAQGITGQALVIDGGYTAQ
jgi:3-hydroxybutyrate dehydrogenase